MTLNKYSVRTIITKPSSPWAKTICCAALLCILSLRKGMFSQGLQLYSSQNRRNLSGGLLVSHLPSISSLMLRDTGGVNVWYCIGLSKSVAIQTDSICLRSQQPTFMSPSTQEFLSYSPFSWCVPNNRQNIKKPVWRKLGNKCQIGGFLGYERECAPKRRRWDSTWGVVGKRRRGEGKAHAYVMLGTTSMG